MSDEEYEYDYGSDQDGGGGSEPDDAWIEIENAFYEGEDLFRSEKKLRCVVPAMESKSFCFMWFLFCRLGRQRKSLNMWSRRRRHSAK